MIVGGQSFVSSPPAFSNDAKKLLLCTGPTVSVFSTDTGMQVAELEGHTDRVTAVIVVPVVEARARRFMHYCWTASLDGSICYWDFEAAELVKRIQTQNPILSMVIPNISNQPTESTKKDANLFAFISVECTSKENNESQSVDQLKESKSADRLYRAIQIYNLTKSRRVGGPLMQTHRSEVICMNNSGEFIALCDKRKLHIWSIPKKELKVDDIRRFKLHHTKELSVLAFHPTERIIAGGDVTGRILIWRGFGKKNFGGGRVKNEDDRAGVRGNDDADSCTTWHWHSSAVKILFFSSDGAYLYSGGNEGVLVVWQLDTGKKKFKPRLGSPLVYYTHSPDPSLSCISCADNQIHLLKMPSMKIIKTIAGIKPPFSCPDVYKRLYSEFVFDHAAGLVALRTEDYCIQFFSLFDNIGVSQVQVCERNFQPVDDVTMFVALVSLSVDGYMMGTVDIRIPEEGLGGLVSLKFWTRGSHVEEYNLTTVIYEPHSDAGISSLAFRPGHNMAVSSSFGGEFKVWFHCSDIQQKTHGHTKFGWRCQSVGTYKKLPMTSAAFSADGSVLAVAAESVITLWDPEKNSLIAVIGDTLTPITTLSFIGKSEYLLSISRGSKPQLTVWDLSTMSIAWSYRLFAEAISCTKDGSHIAVLTLPSTDGTDTSNHDGIILLIDVQNPVSVASWLVKKAKGGGLAFLPPNISLHDNHTKSEDGNATAMLVYMNGDHEYIVFDPYNREGNLIKRNAFESDLPAEEKVPFGYASIYGELPEFKMEKEGQITEIPFATSERPWETIFSGSSHALPPLTKLCSVFLESLLEKRPTVKE